MDIFKKIQQNQGYLGQFSKEAHGYFTYPKLEGEIGTRMKFRSREVLNWSMSDYLGLANHPEVKKADADATAKWGLSYPMGSRIISGQTGLHEDAENLLAEFVKKEDAYLLNSAYQGLVSIIEAICRRNDVIVYDSSSNTAIVDGAHLHFGKRLVYHHNDMASFERQLNKAVALADKQGGGVLVVTEGVFGISGDVAPLVEIIALKEKYEFRLLLDDTHGFGTKGATGAGTAEHFGVLDKVDLCFSAFSRAIALTGAFVAGKESVINYLRYNMRSQILEKSLPLPIVESLIKRLNLLQNHPEFRANLWTIANSLQAGLRAKGFDIGQTQSMITPVYLPGGMTESIHLVMDLRENYNLFCSLIICPWVPKGTFMLHLLPTATHSQEDVEYTINALSEIKTNLEAGKYNAEVVINSEPVDNE